MVGLMPRIVGLMRDTPSEDLGEEVGTEFDGPSIHHKPVKRSHRIHFDQEHSANLDEGLTKQRNLGLTGIVQVECADLNTFLGLSQCKGKTNFVCVKH